MKFLVIGEFKLSPHVAAAGQADARRPSGGTEGRGSGGL